MDISFIDKNLLLNSTYVEKADVIKIVKLRLFSIIHLFYQYDILKAEANKEVIYRLKLNFKMIIKIKIII